MLWDLTVRTRPTRLATVTGAQAIAFSPDGRTLVTGGAGYEVTPWSVINRSRPIHLGGP